MPEQVVSQTAASARVAPHRCTAGVVSYLNARPLIEGLERRPDWRLVPAVPSALPELLDRGEVDVALLPVVEFHRRRDHLRLISDGCIASDGETLTVRVFSPAPPETVSHLLVDGDSRTSVILARLVWKQLYGRDVEVTRADMRQSNDERTARLLIGDKVVTDRPLGYGFEVDLGAAWRHLTGLPMVFAVWACRTDRWNAERMQSVAESLNAARDAGVAAAATIAQREGPRHGWPVELARHYLTQSLSYHLNAKRRAGMQRFLQMADEAGFFET